ncbi:GFA family protein [Caballeronia sp. LZ065]|uniref:GFA family protein n=1 Tax=Caballeronia sp. LZ065 TaxID=3038571 RepID=UPI0028652B7C|nr:GFA family protein [Caballeronia sp. LZ065]MDR5781251.1 GFA family protein [Caballeronia sp. LZ065]
MTLTGRCYCGAIRYRAQSEIKARIQCCCRECQFISGGNPNVIVTLDADTFIYEQGTPKQFTRGDLPAPVTREFCAECGTHLLTRSPRMQGLVLVKVGTLDDPAVFGGPDLVIFTCDRQDFHHVPDDVPTYERRVQAG